MDKIKVRRLSDKEWECETATEFGIKYHAVINSAIEIISKINELVEGYNENRCCYDEIMTNIEGLWKELRRIEKDK